MAFLSEIQLCFRSAGGGKVCGLSIAKASMAWFGTCGCRASHDVVQSCANMIPLLPSWLKYHMTLRVSVCVSICVSVCLCMCVHVSLSSCCVCVYVTYSWAGLQARLGNLLNALVSRSRFRKQFLLLTQKYGPHQYQNILGINPVQLAPRKI
jgi:hypothetical protein